MTAPNNTMKPKFYSQNGEDYLLWNFFGEKREGLFVDIGAFDGIHLSNTYTFELMGWKGICVEPNPEIFALCQRNRPQAICVNEACIGKVEPKKVTFFIDELGLLSSVDNNIERLREIERRYQKRGLPFSGVKQIEVAASSFDEILERYGPKRERTIDYVSIDTEGNELDIVTGIDFNKYDIRVLLIELDQATEGDLIDMLKKKGSYRLSRRTPHNLIFVKSLEDRERMSAIPLNCTIEKQLHPKGIKFTPTVFQKGKVIKDGRLYERTDETISDYG